MKVRKLSWEHVSAIRHPEYYRGERPCVAAGDVPEEHWTRTERTAKSGDDGVTEQYEGLIELVRQGELIRDVCMYEAEAVEPQWVEIAR